MAEIPNVEDEMKRNLLIGSAFVATIVVLVLVSRKRGTAGSTPPASLGTAFVPER